LENEAVSRQVWDLMQIGFVTSLFILNFYKLIDDLQIWKYSKLCWWILL